MAKASLFGVVHVHNEYIPLYVNATYFSLIGSSKFLCVLHADQLVDVVQAIHANELKYSGYKKVLDYVSTCMS